MKLMSGGLFVFLLAFASGTSRGPKGTSIEEPNTETNNLREKKLFSLFSIVTFQVSETFTVSDRLF